jgi:hypothetical protein
MNERSYGEPNSLEDVMGISFVWPNEIVYYHKGQQQYFNHEWSWDASPNNQKNIDREKDKYDYE